MRQFVCRWGHIVIVEFQPQNLFQLTYHWVPTSSRVMISPATTFTVKAWKKVYLQLSDVFLVVGRGRDEAAE